MFLWSWHLDWCKRGRDIGMLYLWFAVDFWSLPVGSSITLLVIEET